MSLEKKIEYLEREINKSADKIRQLYREKIELAEKVKILEEKERYLVSEIERLKKNRISDDIKKRLEKISHLIEKELER